MPITKHPTRPSPTEASLTPSASQRLTHEGSSRVCGWDPDTVTPQDSGVVWVHLVPLDWKHLHCRAVSFIETPPALSSLLARGEAQRTLLEGNDRIKQYCSSQVVPKAK